jgi:hypothetical protein
MRVPFPTLDRVSFSRARAIWIALFASSSLVACWADFSGLTGGDQADSGGNDSGVRDATIASDASDAGTAADSSIDAKDAATTSDASTIFDAASSPCTTAHAFCDDFDHPDAFASTGTITPPLDGSMIRATTMSVSQPEAMLATVSAIPPGSTPLPSLSYTFSWTSHLNCEFDVKVVGYDTADPTSGGAQTYAAFFEASFNLPSSAPYLDYLVRWTAYSSTMPTQLLEFAQNKDEMVAFSGTVSQNANSSALGTSWAHVKAEFVKDQTPDGGVSLNFGIDSITAPRPIGTVSSPLRVPSNFTQTTIYWGIPIAGAVTSGTWVSAIDNVFCDVDQ